MKPELVKVSKFLSLVLRYKNGVGLTEHVPPTLIEAIAGQEA
jgi:RNA:NAD 2'-phosphotransferase (TPT1/KptA family)